MPRPDQHHGTEGKVTASVELSVSEQEALRHELSEPYGHEIRIGIFEKLRNSLDSEPRSYDTISFTEDDRRRLNEIAGELEHLPKEIRRHFDQDGRDARFLRILASRKSEPRSLPEVGVEYCQNWIDNDRCGKPAEFIVWGKLFDPDALGPRCYDCAAGQIGHRALRPNDHISYAVYKLPKAPAEDPSP